VSTADLTSGPTVQPTPHARDLSGIAAAMAARGWTLWHPLAMVALVAAGVYLTWEGWQDIAWLGVYDAESSQVLLVPIITVWLLWIRRFRLASLQPGFSVIGPLLMLLGWAAWEWSYYENVRVASHFAALAIPVGALIAVAGDRLFWKLLPVFGVLLFAIPVPHSIRIQFAGPLQRATAQVTEHFMALGGFDILRRGSVLTLNGTDVGVAEACNGMRSVFALFLVSYLVVFSTNIRPSVRIFALALAPALALVTNIFRLVPTVYLYGYSSAEVAEAFHDYSGWAMYALAFVLMLGALKLVRWILADDPNLPSLTDTPLVVGRRGSSTAG